MVNRNDHDEDVRKCENDDDDDDDGDDEGGNEKRGW